MLSIVVLSRSASLASSIWVYSPDIAWASTQYVARRDADLGEGRGHPGSQDVRRVVQQEAQVDNLALALADGEAVTAMPPGYVYW